MNAQEVIVAGVAARLLAAPAIATQVLRGRRRPMSEGTAQAIYVYFAGSVPERGAIHGAPVDWTTNVRIESTSRAVGTQTAEQAALALNAKAWARLLADQTLGGVAQDIAPGPIDIDEDELDTSLAVVINTLQVVHRTAEHTLEV